MKQTINYLRILHLKQATVRDFCKLNTLTGHNGSPGHKFITVLGNNQNQRLERK